MSSNEERTGVRDLTYSNWHRRALDDDDHLIDVDWLETCRHCAKILAVAETFCIPRDSTPRLKPALITMQLGQGLRVPAYVLGYRPSKQPCICNHSKSPDCKYHGIDYFYIERLNPSTQPGHGDKMGWRRSQEWIDKLHRIRQAHYDMHCPALLHAGKDAGL